MHIRLAGILGSRYLSGMDQKSSTETGWRGSREGWLDAGYKALIENGIDAVKILPLAKQLNLSRTSFYWFFEDRESLLAALLDGWEARTTTPLVASTTQYAETQTEAMFNVIGTFIDAKAFDSKLEFAVRSWALQDDKVAERVRQADVVRLQALSEMLTRWGHDAVQADVRARTVYLVQIGYISMQVQEDLEVRLPRVPPYVEIYTGQPVSLNEIARFNGRFGRVSTLT